MTDFAHFPRPGENYPYVAFYDSNFLFQSMFQMLGKCLQSVTLDKYEKRAYID